MSFVSIIIVSILSVCGASLTGSNTGNSANAATSQSLVMPVSSPEASVYGSHQLAQMNMGNINDMVSQALKNTITHQREPTFNTLGRFPAAGGNPAMITANVQRNPVAAIARAAMPAMASMPFNPLRMMMSGGGSPFSMMNTGMMMNMMENMMDMFSF